MSLETRYLSAIAVFLGIAFWTPAFGFPVGMLPLQLADFATVLGWPLVVVFRRRFTAPILNSVFLVCISFGLSFAVGGSLMVLAYYLALIIPFILLVFLIAQDPVARKAALVAFYAAGACSIALFMVQIAFGAQAFDFRTNYAFQLPLQYGRGFALFPEVSTFAAHAILLLAMSVSLLLHPQSTRFLRHWLIGLVIAALISLMFTRSSSVLVIAPLLIGFAVMRSVRITLNTFVSVVLILACFSVFLAFFMNVFYVDRLLSSSAERSASMRLASVVAGLTPLVSGELFGVGLGNNELIRSRAFDVARAWGLNFGSLPEGINSLIIGRIFEEGWSAFGQFVFSAGILARACLKRSMSPSETALLVLAIGSFLMSLMVTGYRGIYTNWLWIAMPAAFLVRPNSLRSNAS